MALKNANLKQVRQRTYLARDFDGFKAMLLDYARLYYPDKITSFNETSLGGLFLDFASHVGDSMSFYLDHQFGELNYETAVEEKNIERLLVNSGVPITGATPAFVSVTFYVPVPADNVNGAVVPRASCLPIVKSGSVFVANNGTEFILLEDVDFNKKNANGNYVAEQRVNTRTSSGTVSSYVLALSGICISGQETQESFVISDTFVPFRNITLSNTNVSEIVSVYDDLGNEYYQVGSLTHDVVYKNVLNTAKDNNLVRDAIKVIPAPYRFITNTDLTTRYTTLTFGGGNANTLEDDVIPDPSEFAISFPYARTFSRIPINPSALLQTKTLGVAATNTTLYVRYRHGGGLSHNVFKDSIRSIRSLNLVFPNSPPTILASTIRGGIEINNTIDASNGDDAPTVDDLRALVPLQKNAQERIVTREDMVSRVYTMPSNFGRVFRAAVRSNDNNPLATQLFIVSRDADSKLVTSSDTLKNNLRSYINPYRMISDAVDILDARIINLTLSFDVLIDPTLNRNLVLQSVLSKLQKTFDVKNFHIDMPIIIGNVQNDIYSVSGVITVNNIVFNNITGTVGDRSYNRNAFNVQSYTKQGILFPPPGSIFEIKYPEFDIVGKAIV